MSGTSSRHSPQLKARKAAMLLRLRAKKATIGRQLSALRAMNVQSQDALVGTADVTVSLTTHGSRCEQVFFTIEAIGRGTVRPRQIVLWLDDGSPNELPDSLVRLQRRGLRIERTANYGPHTKYFPYVMSAAAHTQALVTADDDVIYQRDWLERLIAASSAASQSDRLVFAHRARRIGFLGEDLAPYRSWEFAVGTAPSVLNFATGVGGVLYPPVLLDALRDAGDAFRGRCDKADDVWLHAVALRHGYRAVQLRYMSHHALTVPYGVDLGLWPTNVGESGNDVAVAATYTAEDLDVLRAAHHQYQV